MQKDQTFPNNLTTTQNSTQEYAWKIQKYLATYKKKKLCCFESSMDDKIRKMWFKNEDNKQYKSNWELTQMLELRQ